MALFSLSIIRCNLSSSFLLIIPNKYSHISPSSKRRSFSWRSPEHSKLWTSSGKLLHDLWATKGASLNYLTRHKAKDSLETPIRLNQLWIHWFTVNQMSRIFLEDVFDLIGTMNKNTMFSENNVIDENNMCFSRLDEAVFSPVFYFSMTNMLV